MAVQIPPNTYTTQVFNLGLDKNLPFGFVDVVLDKSGNFVGFVKNGKFYKPGEKVQEAKKDTELTADQLSKKIDLLTRKLELNRTQASNTNIGEAERNKYIAEYRKTSDELSKTNKSLVETQLKEGKIAEADAQQKAADVIRFDIRALEQRKQLESRLGRTNTELDNQLRQKQDQLNSILNPTPINYGPQPNTVPTSSMPFGGGTITGAPLVSGPISGGIATPGTTAATGAVTGGTAGGGNAGGKKTGTATTPAGGDVTKTPEQRYADAIAMAVEKYNMPDIIFRNIPSLNDLLKRYIDNKLTDKQFALELQNDPWFRSNSAEIKARYVQLFNYEDLVKKGFATGTTDYEQKLAGITRKIQARAREMNGIEIPDDQAKLLAKDLYIYNLDADPAVLTERLAHFIRPSAGMVAGQPTIGYGGQALQNYQALQALAKANGFKIQDILPRDAAGQPMTAEGTLEQLALGKLDINRLAQDVRKLAAIGQPDYVKDLLGQGYNLENIYAPYRSAMASTLELDPNTISLNDPALRMGISKEGDMNLYDFERALRKDGRWQYTQNASKEVAGSVLNVLRDFGFQG